MDRLCDMCDMPILTRVPSFRDIRTDLKDRLRFSLENRDFHTEKAKEFDVEVETLTRLLDRENARFDAPDASKEPDTPLDEYVLGALAVRPMSKEDLRAAAANAGYLKNSDSPGRSIHAVTVNLSKSGKIKEIGDGVFAPADWQQPIMRRL